MVKNAYNTFMKSEKPKITEMFDKLPKVISSCETEAQLIYAKRYSHLAYKQYRDSKVLRVLGNTLISDKRNKLRARG